MQKAVRSARNRRMSASTTLCMKPFKLATHMPNKGVQTQCEDVLISIYSLPSIVYRCEAASPSELMSFSSIKCRKWPSNHATCQLLQCDLKSNGSECAHQ